MLEIEVIGIDRIAARGGGTASLVVPTATIKKRCLAWLNANGIRPSAFEIQVITPEP